MSTKTLAIEIVFGLIMAAVGALVGRASAMPKATPSDATKAVNTDCPDLNAAWAVVERLAADGWRWKIEYPWWGSGSDKVTVEIVRSEPDRGAFYRHDSQAKTLPLAVCDVAKKVPATPPRPRR